MVDAEAIIGIPVLIVLALLIIWLWWFGGFNTVFCDWLGLQSLAVCS